MVKLCWLIPNAMPGASYSVLAAPDEEAFVRERLTGLLAYPVYSAHMAPFNRRSPAILERLPGLPVLPLEQVLSLGDCRQSSGPHRR